MIFFQNQKNSLIETPFNKPDTFKCHFLLTMQPWTKPTLENNRSKIWNKPLIDVKLRIKVFCVPSDDFESIFGNEWM